MRVQAAPPEHHAELARILGYTPTPEFKALEAVDADGQVRGFVALDCWTRNSAQIHIAAQTPIAWRCLIPAMFEWGFRQCGLGVVTGTINSDNERSLALAQRLGFRELCRIRDGQSPGVDLVLFELRREECRWLSQEGQVA